MSDERNKNHVGSEEAIDAIKIDMEGLPLDEPETKDVPPLKEKPDEPSPLIPLVLYPSPPQRRKEQSALEITQRLKRMGWTEIQLESTLLLAETKGGRLVIQAKYSHRQRIFESTIMLTGKECQIVIKERSEERTFTAADILEKRRGKDLEMIMNLRRELLNIALPFFRSLLSEALKKEMKDKESKSVLLLRLYFNVLTGEIKYKAEYKLGPSPTCHFSSEVKGFYVLAALRSEENEGNSSNPILENLGETIIRRIDPLHTIIGLDPWNILRNTSAGEENV